MPTTVQNLREFHCYGRQLMLELRHRGFSRAEIARQCDLASDTLYAIEFNRSISLITYVTFLQTALRLLDWPDDAEVFLTVSRSMPRRQKSKPTERVQ